MNKSFWRRAANRLLHVMARTLPGATTLRPALHRLRGVRIGRGVFIGDGVYIDNEFPEAVEIGDEAQINLRVLVLAHTRGAGRVIIGQSAFVGAGALIVCGGDKTLRIGDGAVVSAGCVVTRNVAPGIVLAPPAARAVARAGTPMTRATTMAEFWANLLPLTTDDDRDDG